MARRRPPVPSPEPDHDLILPRELLEDIPYSSRANAEKSHRQHRERDEWLAAHGVDRADWQTVNMVVTASQQYHGIVDRSWVLVVGDDGTA